MTQAQSVIDANLQSVTDANLQSVPDANVTVPEKKSNMLYIGLGLFFFILVIVGAYFYMSRKPQETIELKESETSEETYAEASEPYETYPEPIPAPPSSPITQSSSRNYEIDDYTVDESMNDEETIEDEEEEDFSEEPISNSNNASYDMESIEEEKEETDLQPNEWLAYRNHWNLEEDKVISKSETFLKKEQVNSSELSDDLKIQITVGMEATYIRQLNNDYYIVNYQTSEMEEEVVVPITSSVTAEDLTMENANLAEYSLRYDFVFNEMKFDEMSLWLNWLTVGEPNNAIMNKRSDAMNFSNKQQLKNYINRLNPMNTSDIASSLRPTSEMPKIPAWGLLKTDDGVEIKKDGNPIKYIWNCVMPNYSFDAGNSKLMSVPINIFKIWTIYENPLSTTMNVKLYINVDDRCYVIHNFKYITQISGWTNNPGIELELTPGLNSFCFVVDNSGGPAGFQAAMLPNPTTSNAPLLSTTDTQKFDYQDNWFLSTMGSNVTINSNYPEPLRYADPTRLYKIKPVHSGKCLESKLVDDKYRLRQESCLVPVPQANGNLNLANNNEQSSQDFLIHLENQTYKIKDFNGKCLDVPGYSTENSEDLQFHECKNVKNTNQLWNLEGNGRIRSYSSKKCLDIKQASLADGAIAMQFDCHDNDNQKFEINSNDFYRGAKAINIPEVNVDGQTSVFYNYYCQIGPGQTQKATIHVLCDDFCVMWVDRKIIGAKGINDTTTFHCKFRPGKNQICFNVMNYGGPGYIAAQAVDENGLILWKTNDEPYYGLSRETEQTRWRYMKTGWKPGPWAETILKMDNTERYFWYGIYNGTRMENKGISNDSLEFIKNPSCNESMLFKDSIGGDTQFVAKSRSKNSLAFGVSSVVIKTPTIDRVLFFKHASNRGAYKKYPGLTNISGLFENQYDYNNRLIEDDSMSGFYMPKNFKITLYDGGDLTGIQYSNSNDNEDVVKDYIGDNVNDIFTSIKIEKLNTYNPYEIFNLELLGVPESILYEHP